MFKGSKVFSMASAEAPNVLPAHVRRRNPLLVACMIVFALFLMFLIDAFLLNDFVPDGFAATLPKTSAEQDIVGWKPGKHVLRFSDSGTFQVSIFEDLHYGEGM